MSIGERVEVWVRRCFGDAAMSRPERAARLLEEVAELAQAEGVERDVSAKIVSRAYSRPPGTPTQEAGGVGVCLAAWERASGVDVAAETEREVTRIENLPDDHFRKRHAAKIAAGTTPQPPPPKLFPIQPAERKYPRAAAPLRIPWSVAEKAYSVYATRYGTDQSLARMAERGGFAVEEMDVFYPPWRDEVSEIEALKSNAIKLVAAVAEVANECHALSTAQLEFGMETVRRYEAARDLTIIRDRLRALVKP